MLTIADATAYIDANVLVPDDWAESDDSRKQRVLNVANRTLAAKYAEYTIPDNAVYEYAAVLATATNDTNRLSLQGIAGFSVTGVAQFTFAQNASKDLVAMIPRAAIDLINADPANANMPKVSTGRAVKWTVL